ncbi:MAG TPA: hypothetical protein PKY50_19430 [Candidatus Competibacter sp.]|nr:hypothetical protein [Candidatus Competibacter sp.]
MSNIDDVQKYKKNSYIFLLIIITYILIGQTLISYGLDKYSISNLFLGIPKLTIETNIIEIQLNNDAYKIGLHFETALKESIEPLDISIVDSSSEIDQKKDYEISLSSDRTWIHISSNNKTLSLRDKPIKILLSNKKGASRAIKRFIDKIRINDTIKDTDFPAKYSVN